MLAWILAVAAALNLANSGVTQFRKIPKYNLPAGILAEASVCKPYTPRECREHFDAFGGLWAADVDGDGAYEFLVKTGTKPTDGDDFLLFQKSAGRWTEILKASPFHERLDILPIRHDRYRDLCLEEYRCFKWTGARYEAYAAEDYHQLKGNFFDARYPEDAPMLWLSHYAGLKQFTLEPLWMIPPKRLEQQSQAVLKDADGTSWFGIRKGDVWAVSGRHGYLVLPRPAYLGCGRLESDGDWVLIYGEIDTQVARFNRRTKQMILLAPNLYWSQSQ
jgi:hypothetical protein